MLKAAVLFLILLLSATATIAGSVKARTLSGIGVLLINRERPQITLFKEAAIGRIAETTATALPLSQSLEPPEGYIAAIVTAKKGGWFRILYDDAEREGWIEGRPAYQYYDWKELLSNRQIQLLGGLKKEFYQLRKYPDFSAAALQPVGKGVALTSLRSEGEWLSVVTDDAMTEGWLRWCDDNSRLVISLQF